MNHSALLNFFGLISARPTLVLSVVLWLFQLFLAMFVFCDRDFPNITITVDNRCINVKWFMKCFIYWTADLKSSKLWSSQLRTQFKQLPIDRFARSRVQTPLKSWLFQASIRNCLNCVRNCDDHRLLDFKSAVQYMKHFIYHFTFLILSHFDVICALLLNRCSATWNLFVLYHK